MDAHEAQGGVPQKDMRNSLGEHVVTDGSTIREVQFVVMPGEDIASKIYEFIEQHEDQAMYVAEAKGSVASLTIPNFGESGGLVTLEGRFEIISLSGLSMSKVSDDGRIQRDTNLSIVIPDQIRGLAGGSICGPLIAASRVNIKMGLFSLEINKGGNPEGDSGSVDAGNLGPV